ncbi:ubiquinol-cytochrome c reductase subunit 9 [Malassezia restricta]|uniref:ubiquinol-cytochrome c reductase subunit 9 n=1 Tax=Malassezia restricta TaxID=76775 RepID=UPI000DD1507A|nr:ubiquinol-cytochrome c reductase subunit 9 [Malassezia restricta]AXA50744.1 ubiquinol-cytochrome c reductase subunit 9 [Malassezia restricta]
MSLATGFYNLFVRRNSIFVGTIFAGAFGFGIAFDTLTEKWWDMNNKGRQWKDIRDKILASSEDE